MKHFLYIIILFICFVCNSQNLTNSKNIYYSNDNSKLLIDNNLKTAQTNEHQPDSILGYNYSSTTDSILTSKHYFKYDDPGNTISDISFFVSQISNEWVGNNRIERKYDINGNAIYFEQYTYSQTRNDWHGYMKYYRKYDLKTNNIQSYSNYDWSDDLWSWILVDSTKIEHEYNGDTLKVIVSKLNFENNSWLENGKQEIINRDSLKISILYTRDQNTLRWIASSKTIRRYNEKGKELSELQQKWDESKSEWINDYNATYYYDNLNRECNFNSYFWDASINQWINAYQSEKTYNTNGKIIIDVSFKWDTIYNDWIGYFKEILDYDDNGNQILSNTFQWHSDQWISTGKTEITYDLNGNIISYTDYKNWNRTTNAYNNKSEYFYDENGNQILSFYYIWDEIDQNWINKSKSDSFFDSDGRKVSNTVYRLDTDINQLKLTNKLYYFYSDPNDTQITDLKTSEQIQLFPNPADEIINIKISELSANRCEIYNSGGQLMNSFEIQKGVNSINIGNLKSGLYLLKIHTNGGFVTKKIIK